MKKKLYAHPDIIIAVFAIVLFCVLVSFYSWATDAIVEQIRRSLTSATPQSAAGFNLDGASKLDLRGLLGQSSSYSGDVQAEIPVAPSPVTPAPVVVAPPVTAPLVAPASTPTPVSTSTPPVVAPPVVSSTAPLVVPVSVPAVQTSTSPATSTPQAQSTSTTP